LYPDLIKPLVDLTNANIETFSRFAKSPEIANFTRAAIEQYWRAIQDNLTRVTQSDAFAELTKQNVENFSRFASEYARGVYMIASQTEAEITRGVQEAARRFEQVSNTASNLISVSTREVTKAVGSSAQEGARAFGASAQEATRAVGFAADETARAAGNAADEASDAKGQRRRA
jgi:hypothetical protein